MAITESFLTRFPGRLGNRQFIFHASAALLIIEIALFLFVVAGTYGLIVPLAKPTSTDFVSFYAAGSLADARHTRSSPTIETHIMPPKSGRPSPGSITKLYYYPPVFLLLCGAVARLPYLWHSSALRLTTFGLYLLVATQYPGRAQAGWICCRCLAFPPVSLDYRPGTERIFDRRAVRSGDCCSLIGDRRLAGLLFGALCYKPHFALLVPCARRRRWRGFAAAFASAVALCLLSLVVFGWQTWHDFLTAAAASQAVYASGKVGFAGFVTPFGAVCCSAGTQRRLLAAGHRDSGRRFPGGKFGAAPAAADPRGGLVSATLVAVPGALL